ncbi:MAG: ferritin [Ezakiella sp.]|nr:ferritin [Ezakiella sp.]
MISKRLADKINEQLNFELESGYIYKGMEAFFGNEGLTGFQHFMKLQAEEEYAHHDKFANFLYETGNKVEYTAIPEVKNEYKCPKEVMQVAYEHEQEVTKRIKELYEIALEEKDYVALTTLDWFLHEQIEEEDTFRGIMDRFALLGEANTTLYWIDKELGHRE